MTDEHAHMNRAERRRRGERRPNPLRVLPLPIAGRQIRQSGTTSRQWRGALLGVIAGNVAYQWGCLARPRAPVFRGTAAQCFQFGPSSPAGVIVGRIRIAGPVNDGHASRAGRRVAGIYPGLLFHGWRQI